VHKGGNFIDTADVYSEWKEGNSGGESESIIGAWAKGRGVRESLVIATKVAKLSTRPGLSAKNIVAACDDSLRRLQSDYIDIYYAHEDDETTPLEETLEAFTGLVQQGKVRYIAASNYSPERLARALAISKENDFASYIGVQNWYNLLDRKEFEDGVAKVVIEKNLASMPFYGLARGFLSGKYQPNQPVESVRAGGVAGYQNDRGWKTLKALEEISRSHSTSVASIALAWLRAQPSVSVPIASARTIDQLDEIMEIVDLLPAEIALLSEITQ
jgi:aryl-alcohol dehydrogenase-like predicted oxidoreductase